MYADPNFVLTVPPGKKTGCLPRASRFGDVSKILSDDIEPIPRDRWAPLIAQSRGLRPLVWTVLDQDSVGSCAAESTGGGLIIVRAGIGLKQVRLNPWFAYHTTSGGRDAGSSIDANLVFAREHGIAPESVWPRSKGWRETPSAEAIEAALSYRIDEFYDIGSIVEMGTALLRGFPVLTGSNGHAFVLTRLIDESTAEWLNSWDETWGDKGFGTVRLSSLNFGYGAFAIRTASIPSDEALVSRMFANAP